MPIKIISAEVNNDRMVKFRLSRALSIRQVAAGGAIILNPGQSQISSLPLVRSDSAMVSQIWAYFGELPPGVAQLVWNIEPEKPAAVFDSLKIPASRDTTPPYIVSVNPDDRPVLYPDTNISLRFSEPIRFASLADTSLSIWSIGDSTPLLYDKMIGGQLELIVKPRGLVAGGSYRLQIFQSNIIDFTGNAMGDSISHFSISVLKPDSLGWIEGKVAVPLADSAAHVNLVFRRLKDSRNFVFSDIARSFKIALPAGKYLVTGHVDRNANGQFDKGTIFPYTPSEPFLPFRDTVSVRARFETAGVELNFR